MPWIKQLTVQEYTPHFSYNMDIISSTLIHVCFMVHTVENSHYTRNVTHVHVMGHTLHTHIQQKEYIGIVYIIKNCKNDIHKCLYHFKHFHYLILMVRMHRSLSSWLQNDTMCTSKGTYDKDFILCTWWVVMDTHIDYEICWSSLNANIQVSANICFFQIL